MKFNQLAIVDIPMLTKDELETLLQYTDNVLLLNTQNHDLVDARIKTIQSTDELKQADAIVTRTGAITAELIDSCSNLKYIGAYTTGFENIAVKHAQSKGIKVTHVPGYANIAVAEHIIGQLLFLCRRFHTQHQQVMGKTAEYGGSLGYELYGRTLGIVGLGRLGTELAKRLQAFGCKLCYYDIFRQEQKEKDMGIEFLDNIDALIAKSDLISIHMPLTEQTKNMFSKERIKAMKDWAILINTARGEIVDNDALIEETNAGRIFGVCDVGFAEHPQLLEKINEKNHNLVLSHHSAFNTAEAFERRKQIFLENIKNYLSGEKVFEARVFD